MKIEEIKESVFHIRFESKYLVTSTFMRLQEFYESPIKSIKGKYFSIEKYMDEYAKLKGNFTYNSDWSGFNVPDYIVRVFFELFDFDLTQKEKNLKKCISNLLSKNQKFYLIATYDDDDLAHEIAHGYYYLDDLYRECMDGLIDQLQHKREFSDCLLDRGYNKEVLNDEIQAYLATSDMDYLKEELGYQDNWDDPYEFQDIFLHKNSE